MTRMIFSFYFSYNLIEIKKHGKRPSCAGRERVSPRRWDARQTLTCPQTALRLSGVTEVEPLRGSEEGGLSLLAPDCAVANLVLMKLNLSEVLVGMRCRRTCPQTALRLSGVTEVEPLRGSEEGWPSLLAPDCAVANLVLMKLNLSEVLVGMRCGLTDPQTALRLSGLTEVEPLRGSIFIKNYENLSLFGIQISPASGGLCFFICGGKVFFVSLQR